MYRRVCCNDNFFSRFSQTAERCDVTIGDATMSRHRMTSRSTDERQQRLGIGHRLPKRHQLLFQTERRPHAKRKARKCSSLRAHTEETFCDVTIFKKPQHKAKYRVLATAKSTSCFTKVEREGYVLKEERKGIAVCEQLRNKNSKWLRPWAYFFL